MVERSDQIEKHIASTRSELGSNLQELEDKVKQAADWRTYFERNPMMVMGLALGGGVLLGTMLGASNRVAGIVTEEHQNGKRSRDGSRNPQVADSWGVLKGALIGLAGAKVRDVLNEALPGFNEQYDKMEKTPSAARMQAWDFESSAPRM
jgi:hypothetical protein